MNYNRRVLQLVLLFTTLLFLVSCLQYALNLHWLPLQRINLVADVVNNFVRKKPGTIAALPLQKDSLSKAKEGNSKDLSLYLQGKLITNFNF